MFDILIIGSGPSGLTAGIYAARANKKVGIIEGKEPCGQLTKTTYIENFPGFSNPILGTDLMENIHEQAENLGVEFIDNIVVNIDNKNDIFIVQTEDSNEITALSIIVCTGSSPKMLGLERNLVGYGISTCATCDGAFFKQKTVAIIGGGDSAAEEAIYLSNIAQKIYVIHRNNKFRCEQIMYQRMIEKDNIEILTPYQTIQFLGDKKLGGIMIENSETKEIKKLLLDGAFIAIGQNPNTKFLENLLTLTQNGYIKNGPTTEIPGLFSAGDVMDQKYRQAITAAGFGCMAAIEAIKYLSLK